MHPTTLPPTTPATEARRQLKAIDAELDAIADDLMNAVVDTEPRRPERCALCDLIFGRVMPAQRALRGEGEA